MVLQIPVFIHTQDSVGFLSVTYGNCSIRVFDYRIALNYSLSHINAWSCLVAGGIQHHNKNKFINV